MTPPLGFALAVHVHQPVGNDDRVFREHVDEVYRPFLRATAAGGCRPITLHVSGPLLDWLEDHDPSLLDEIGTGVADGEIELLGSGRYEPILAALPRRDRVEQVAWMRDDVTRRFGTTPTGLWLTERVWEQDLAADLAAAGVAYTLLDDRRFLAAGLLPEELDRPYHTEAGGGSLAVLPIDERLRYLVPFRPAAEIEGFLRARHARGAGIIVLGDDGEKFGGWPGTRRWVYERGWLDAFLDMLERLRGDGTVEPITTADAAARESGGLAYPVPGSYREMEEWTLPRPAALELEHLRATLTDGVDDATRHPAIRGGHWRSFQRRYPLSNRMHKTALALSHLCRERGDPPEPRRAIGRAQCNDAYWHGVFGGVYLPHLRRAIWRELAEAERSLRADEALAAETLDWDRDGHEEIWVHGPAFSAIVSPVRGGAIESLLRLDTGENDADVLARHFEAYHGEPGVAPDWSEVRDLWLAEAAAADDPSAATEGAASIHDREPPERPAPPAIDRHARSLFRDSVGPAAQAADPVAYRLREIDLRDDVVVLHLEGRPAAPRLRKRIDLAADGTVSIALAWSPEDLDPAASVWTEVSLAWPRTLTATGGASRARERIVTLARSERGYEEILQGEAWTFGWPAGAGSGSITLARQPLPDARPAPRGPSSGT